MKWGFWYGREKAAQALGIDDRWLLRAGILLLALFIPLLFLSFPPDPWEYLLSIGVSFLNVLLYWSGNRQIVVHYRLKFPGFAQIWQRFLQQMLVVTFYSVLVALFIHLTLDIPLSRIPGRSLFPLTYGLLLGLSITYFVLGVYETIYYFQRWKASVIEQEKLQVAQARSELESLKNQVNPHFLFNSLNTLAALIPRAPEQATTFVQHLSKVYRYVLEVPATHPVTLAEELQFLEDYIFLLRTRHGEALKVELIGIDAHQDALMIPLALQILVENAVKHNVVSQKHPLQLRIEATTAGLSIGNSRKPKAGTVHSTGLGLNNLRARYLLLGKTAIEVSAEPTQFKVRLPWIEEISNDLAGK